MADASVPKSEQSLIVVLDTNGNWANTMLISIDDAQLNVPSSMFYIPSGIRTLSFRTTTSSFQDSNYVFKRDRTEYVRTTATQTAGLQITDTFLPGHTYRMVIRNAANVKIEDITNSVDWLNPQVSLFSPKNGVLTNFADPREFYVIPAFNSGWYLQYTHQFDGREALILGHTGTFGIGGQVIYAEKGVTGLSPVLGGMFFQGGLDFGWKKVGLTTMAEINGGIGFGGDIPEIGYNFLGLNCGYLFVGELYYLNTIGVGFGYGKTSMVPQLAMPSTNLPAYDYLLPYFRGELLFFPKTVIPITIYANYFFDHDKWAFGILASFAGKREWASSSSLLQ
jgi:hypothetical protein